MRREPGAGANTAISSVATSARLVPGALFALGLLLYVAVQSGLVLLATQGRSAPVEVDDAYTYLLKAVQMVTCFRQDCPALEDLRAQVTPASTDPELDWVRYREHARAFLVYHPLHSAVVSLLHVLGLSWEKAYAAVQLAGSLFIAIGVACWLGVLWGSAPAGVALALLAVVVFPGQGLHQVVPSNLALAIAMLVWARICAHGDAARWTLVAGVVALAAMHPIGRLYGLASVALFLSFARRRWRMWPNLAVVLLALALVGLSFLLPVIMSRPELAIRPDPPPTGWPKTWYGMLGAGLSSNLGTVDWVVKSWMGLYGSVASAVVLTALGLLGLQPVRRSIVIKQGLVLAGLLLVSTVHVLPRYPADLFQRVWIPMAILLTGAAGQAACVLLSALGSGRARVRRSGRASARLWILALAVTAVVFLALRVETGVVQGLSELGTALASMREEQRWILDPAQPELLLSRARPTDAVLYLDEVPMHFYLVHGGLGVRAVYYPALAPPSTAVLVNPQRRLDSPRVYRPVAADASPEMARWLDPRRLHYVVGWNPVQQLPGTQDAMVRLSTVSRIDYSSPVRVGLDRFRVYLVNFGNEAVLELRYTAGSTTKTLAVAVPGAWAGWLSLPSATPDEAPGAVSLSMDPAHADVYLKGLGFGPPGLNWPWAQRATLVFHAGDSGGGRTIRFDPSDLLPIRGLPASVEVLSDSGSTVLAEIARSPGEGASHPDP